MAIGSQVSTENSQNEERRTENRELRFENDFASFSVLGFPFFIVPVLALVVEHTVITIRPQDRLDAARQLIVGIGLVAVAAGGILGLQS